MPLTWERLELQFFKAAVFISGAWSNHKRKLSARAWNYEFDFKICSFNPRSGSEQFIVNINFAKIGWAKRTNLLATLPALKID